MENKNNSKLDELVRPEDLAKEMEIESILLKANESKEETLFFTNEGHIELKNEITSMLDSPIDNPEEKYELYYNIIAKILKDYLPAGKQNEEARKIIYEEKNTYLTRGHRKNKKGVRYADSRMSYNADMKELVDIIFDWASTSRNAFDLYIRLRDLNKSKGYGLSDIGNRFER